MSSTILITGGAGFIGVNTALRFARKGWDVVVLDNLSRSGSARNLEWLRANAKISFEPVDVRDAPWVLATIGQYRPDVVLHLAAQVAVTTSLVNPRNDFEVNTLGTLNVLEAIRLDSPESLFLFSSTNKVYGRMEDLDVVALETRYQFRDLPQGVDERRPLDFCSPYGCSKGAADQYALDYHRNYGLRTIVLRLSCVYGPHQFGVEDQGWVAWFTIASLLNRPITICGDGKQVRDILYIDDLVALFERAATAPEPMIGSAFNVGGGSTNSVSLLELLDHLERRLDRSVRVQWDQWRQGDQPVYVADLTRVSSLLAWSPRTDWRIGVTRLAEWVEANPGLFLDHPPRMSAHDGSQK